jgi:hypothetical protein
VHVQVPRGGRRARPRVGSASSAGRSTRRTWDISSVRRRRSSSSSSTSRC